MPKAFDQCNKSGGRVRTITKGPNKGKLICFKKGSGKAVLGNKRGK